jgi:hypothetical protein
MKDEELECRDCQGPFTFTVGEQKFFQEKVGDLAVESLA